MRMELTIAFCLALFASPAAGQQAQFIPLPLGFGGTISSDGNVIAGAIGSPLAQAARWTSATSVVGLGLLPGGTLSRAAGVSSDGSTVVGQADAPGPWAWESFLWTAASGMVGLGCLPGAMKGEATDVSLDGSVAVGVNWFPGYTEPYRWDAAGGMVGLGGLPGQPLNGVAYATNSDGSVIVGWATQGSELVPIRWTAASGMVSLGILPGYTGGLAVDVSSDGNTVVGHCWGPLGSEEAFVWTRSGGMVGLGDLPGGPFQSWALGVSDSGLVVVGSGRNGNGSHALMWTPTQSLLPIYSHLTSLGVTSHFGWALGAAQSVSGDGLRIQGSGLNPAGQSQNWLAILPNSWTEYCTGKMNSLGCTPVISATGVPSAANVWTFVVRASSVLNQTAGLFFYKVGGGGASIPFQGGTLCVGPSGIRRTPVVTSGGTPAPPHDCSGAYTLDVNAFAHGQLGGNPDPALLTPGTIYRMQAWGRDQGFAAPNNTSLSNALEVPIGP
jgi:uncharacterized membrane protein